MYCLRPRAKTPRPPGEAGRYEYTLEGYGPPNLPERVYQQSDSEAAAGHVACRRFAFFDSNCPYSPETAFAAAATSATGAGASVMTPMACKMMTRMPSTAT